MLLFLMQKNQITCIKNEVMVILLIEKVIDNKMFPKSTAGLYISDSYQRNFISHRHRIFYGLYERNITIVLCSNIVIIAVISILYELSREYELDLCVFFLVSLGYPIRFFAGLCVAYPQVHIDLSSKIPPELSQTLILLFLYVSW